MINFTAWPEMLAWPYLMLQGWLPYKDIAIAHNPLLLFDLAIFFKFFGVGILQLKIYTWILIAINIYLVYFVSKMFWNKKIAFLSTIFYLLLTIIFEGNGLWFDLALTPFALLLYLFLRENKYIWSGVVFALGFLTKQTFIYFAIPVLILAVQSTKDIVQRLKQFLIGVFLVLAVFTLYLISNNLISDYYNWAIKFGILYLPNANGQISLPSVKQFVFAMFSFLVLLFTSEYSLIIFAIVGLLGVYPRWELFHFQPALPFVAIAVATIIFSKKDIILKLVVATFCMLYMVYGVSRQIGNNTRFFEPQVHSLVESIQDLNTKELYVISYWDNIYALTNTLPATKPLIPYIPWYLNYGENKTEILNDLKTEMPDEIVIGERDTIFPDLYSFVDKFYACNMVDKKVELCIRNNSK